MKIFMIIVCLSLFNCSFGQYKKEYSEGKRHEKNEEYYHAIQSYNIAVICTDKPSFNDINERIEYCAKKLNNLLIQLGNEKKKVDSILNIVNKKNAELDTALNINKLLANEALRMQKFNDSINYQHLVEKHKADSLNLSLTKVRYQSLRTKSFFLMGTGCLSLGLCLYSILKK